MLKEEVGDDLPNWVQPCPLDLTWEIGRALSNRGFFVSNLM